VKSWEEKHLVSGIEKTEIDLWHVFVSSFEQMFQKQAFWLFLDFENFLYNGLCLKGYKRVLSSTWAGNKAQGPA